jgi:hypothetical protein
MSHLIPWGFPGAFPGQAAGFAHPSTYPADFSRQRGLVDEPRIKHDRFFNTLTEHRLRAVLTVDIPNLACVAGKLDGFVQQRPRRGGHVPRYHVEDVTVAYIQYFSAARLFEGAAPGKLRLVGAAQLPSGVVSLTYSP